MTRNFTIGVGDHRSCPNQERQNPRRTAVPCVQSLRLTRALALYEPRPWAADWPTGLADRFHSLIAAHLSRSGLFSSNKRALRWVSNDPLRTLAVTLASGNTVS
jgi:hypothetical protein